MAVVAFAVTLAGTAWLQRSEDVTLAIDPEGPVRVRSTAGPIEVVDGPTPQIAYRSSWLVRGPTAAIEPGGFDLRCDTRWPCRAASTVVVPSGSAADLDVHAVDQDLLVTSFSGSLLAVAEGDGNVILGPVAGKIRVVTTIGEVVGHQLMADEVEVVTDSGHVSLDFARQPRSVVVSAGVEPVTILLPPGRYAVSVEGTPVDVAPDAGIVQAADAEHRLSVRARGPVRIESST